MRYFISLMILLVPALSSAGKTSYLDLLQKDLLFMALHNIDYSELRSLATAPDSCEENNLRREQIRTIATKKEPSIFKVGSHYEIRDPAQEVEPFILATGSPVQIDYSYPGNFFLINASPIGVDQDRAAKSCEQDGKRLPNLKELYALKRAGFNGGWFWSSDLIDSPFLSAAFFYDNGQIGERHVGTPSINNYVTLCVKPMKGNL